MLIKLQSVVVADRKSPWDLEQEANEPVISWSEAIVDELGRLRGPAAFVVNDTTEVYVRQKTLRTFWSYGAVYKSVINQRSVTEEVRELEMYSNISSEEMSDESTSTVRSHRSHHSSALHSRS